MRRPTFDQYLEYRQRFVVSRESAVKTLAWAEPLAREALGVHAHRDQMDMGDELHFIPVMTTAMDNGGWGELMPVWFKPYERPLPLFILDNWAMPALMWHYWLGESDTLCDVEVLLKIFLGSSLLIPFLPQVQHGGHFLRHGAFTVFLAILWLEPQTQAALLPAIETGAQRFAELYQLHQKGNLSEFMAQLEFEAFFVAEGNKIGGEDRIRAFLADETQFSTYAALFGGLCFSLAALHNWVGSNWRQWIFQKVNLDYRLARFGLEAWAKWLNGPPGE